MKQRDFVKLIIGFVYDWVVDNWDRINLKHLEGSKLPTDKARFLLRLEYNIDLAMWIITEISYWGMLDGEDAMEHIYPNGRGVKVIKINGHLIGYLTRPTGTYLFTSYVDTDKSITLKMSTLKELLEASRDRGERHGSILWKEWLQKQLEKL